MLGKRVRRVRDRIVVYAAIRFFACASAPAVVEMNGISLGNPLKMPAIGAVSRKRQIHLSVKLKFLGNDAEGKTALVVACLFVGALDGLAYHRIRRVFDVIRKVGGGKRRFIIFLLGLAPRIILGQSLFFSEREKFLRGRFVVAKGAHFGRKEFAVFIYVAAFIGIGILIHVFDNAGAEFFVFLFCILRV